jgi:hypothetical protein
MDLHWGKRYRFKMAAKRKSFSKNLLLVSLTAIAVVGIVIVVVNVLSVRNAIQTKVQSVQSKVEDWVEHGYDPSAVLKVMQKVKAASEEEDAAENVGKLLDKALALLDAPPAKRPKAKPAPGEEPSDLYVNPQPVAIEGYEGQSMEPFISPDGKFLFFNNENDSGADIDLHVAERTGTNSFHYLGPLKNANSRELDAVPSMDTKERFYFTTSREYEKTFKSIYAGVFENGHIGNLHLVQGGFSPNKLGIINMDVGISPDGNTMYISRAVFKPGLTAPEQSDLMVAHLHDGAFEMDPQSRAIMKNINTNQLEYAPAISADGRELYFTRAQAPEANVSGPQFRIMVATRGSNNAPFGKPRVLAALTGMIEAPTVSLDMHEMFFHKKVNGKWVIWRAVRKGGVR